MYTEWFNNGEGICPHCGEKMHTHKPMTVYVRIAPVEGLNPCLTDDRLLYILNHHYNDISIDDIKREK